MIQNDYETTYIDDFILTAEDLKEYDINATYLEVTKKIRQLKKARNIYINGIHLRLTSNYQPQLESYNFKPTDKVGNDVEYRLDSEQEYNEFNCHLEKLYKTMSKIEIAYINDCLLSNKSENFLKTKFNLTRKNFEDVKNSSIVRFALAFNLIKYKQLL